MNVRIPSLICVAKGLLREKGKRKRGEVDVEEDTQAGNGDATGGLSEMRL